MSDELARPGADARSADAPLGSDARPANRLLGAGGIVLAATPLGDARDASARLRELIATADLVAAEDTRRFRALAAALDTPVHGSVISHYDAVEADRMPGLLDAVRDGRTVLVVTDAGMPAISDPGYRLVAAAAAEDLPVTCVPGPSAVTTALVLSGLPCDRFCFEGFAPRRPGERRRWLDDLRTEPRATVFFESPRRVAELLADAVEVLGPDRPAAVCRELTKRYEQVRRGPLVELAAWAGAEPVRGEVTVVLAGAPPVEGPTVGSLVPAVRERIAGGERLKDAVADVASAAGVSKRELYNATLAAG